MPGLRVNLATVSLGLAACAPGAAISEPAVYLSAPSSISIEVWDSGDRLSFRYRDDQEHLDGDGVPEGRVRCGYIVRISVCVISDPTEGQRKDTSDGGFVVASRLAGDRWRFLYHPARWQGDDCNYAIWSAGRGVMEFGPTTCTGTPSRSAVWSLVEGRGFF